VSVVLGFVVGVLAVRLLVGASRDLVHSPALARPNRDGRVLPTAIGVLAVAAVVLVEAGRSLFGAFGVGEAPAASARVLVVLACLGFGLLGLLDDLVVKIVGGCALAVVLVSADRVGVSGARVVADAFLVALAANLSNLFDRAPGRAIKVGLVAWVPLALVARADSVGVAVAPVIGAFAGLLGDDLRERLMLGDTGANALGAVLGLAVVLECGATVRTIVLGVLVVLTFTSEFVSFSRVIDRVSVLRRLDDLGRGG
jgi:UDP-GlcNAc:undecaprenyl-phosphate GlcNAc-1-phosphate transferase